MRKRNLTLLTIVIAAVIASANGKGLSAQAARFGITAKVRDKVTGIDLTDALYRVIQLPDSAVVQSGETITRWMTGSSDNWIHHSEPGFTVNDLDSDNSYLLEITKNGYEPIYLGIDPSGLGKRENIVNLGNLELKKAHALDEVTVTATKVKFYNKGDTVVYNADAFQLAEGSMLDALISQLPGVELKEDGQILVDGRKVESLLLNSKDFFKGDNKIMLENLGAFTVKNIAVYDGQREEDRIMGKDYRKTILTMDVRLKKEYNRGFMFNVEAGYGIRGRFLGRLFGLRFDDRSRIGFYGNANNISNLRQPNEKEPSAMPRLSAQDVTTYAGGADYLVAVPRSPMSFSGNATVAYTKTNTDKSTYTTNFLTGGDTYGYSFSNGRMTTLNVGTEHTVKADADNWNWRFVPKFRFAKNTAESRLMSATFNREWDDIDRSFLEGIHSGNASQALASMINRHIRDKDSNGCRISVDMTTEGKRKVNQTDAVRYSAAYAYERKHSTDDEFIQVDYDANPKPSLSENRHRDTAPDFNWRAKGSVGYIFALTRNLYADFSYTYQRNHSHTESELYRKEEYLERQAVDGLGNLTPSTLNGYGSLDQGNSFNSSYKEEIHDMTLEVDYDVSKGVSLWAAFPFTLRRQWLHYLRGEVDERLNRTRFFPGDFSLSANIYCNRKKPIWIYIGYDRHVVSPDMVDMVDFTDRLDPLNVRMGNPDLKDASSENIRAYYSQTLDGKRGMKHGYGVDATLYSNSLAYGYSYDHTTGVKTGMMYNVMGNASYSGYQSFNMDFGRLNCMSFGNYTRLAYRRSADMLSSDAALPKKNIVNTYGISETLSLAYSRSAFKITGVADVNWKRFTSVQTGFLPFGAWDMRYTLSGNFKLPANFAIDSDFNIYARRGYTESCLNRNNYVWNARISYGLMKGSMLLMLDGFDILHNLSNISYAVNAQARTETYTGVLPRYFMFHVQWKLNKAPVKK